MPDEHPRDRAYEERMRQEADRIRGRRGAEPQPYTVMPVRVGFAALIALVVVLFIATLVAP